MEHSMKETDVIVERLRATTDAKEKVAVAGLIHKPFNEHATQEECGNCIYFLRNHKFCDMPELQFPVASDWWCRLWRV